MRIFLSIMLLLVVTNEPLLLALIIAYFGVFLLRIFSLIVARAFLSLRKRMRAVYLVRVVLLLSKKVRSGTNCYGNPNIHLCQPPCLYKWDFRAGPKNDGLVLACKNVCFYEKESVQKNCLKSSRTLS